MTAAFQIYCLDAAGTAADTEEQSNCSCPLNSSNKEVAVTAATAAAATMVAAEINFLS